MKNFIRFLLLLALVCVICFAVSTFTCDGAEMTDAEFYTWAVDQNAKAKAEWSVWRKTAPPRWISYTTVILDGHSNGPRHQTYIRGARTHSTSGGYRRHHYELQSFQKRYLNPDHRSRPLTIINPYCNPKR